MLRVEVAIRWCGYVAIACSVSWSIHACATRDLQISDDSFDPDATATPGTDATVADGPSKDVGEIDGAVDGSVDGDSFDAGCPAPATCATGALCANPLATGNCPGPGTCCCPLPSLLTPVCDAGLAPVFAPNGCMLENACAPVACAAAGGTCTPTNGCPNPAKVGDGSLYTCPASSECCLP